MEQDPEEPSAAGETITVPPSITRSPSGLSDAELKRRASAGLFVVASWGFLNLVTAFIGNLILARLLDPTVFGIVAVGSTVIAVTGAFTEGGLGNGLVRRTEPPTEAEFRTLTGIQFGLTVGAAAVIAVIAVPFGTVGEVTALMVCAMPISSFQSAGRVALARKLQLREITAVDATAVIGYYVWSIGAVLLGMGVWGLATGTVVRAIAGTLAMAAIPGGRVRRPSLELLRRFGGLMAYGAKFQANWIVIIARDQGLNAITGLVGGLATLGLWSLASRLMLLPQLLYDSIGRVTFPTMAHILATEKDPRPLIVRASGLSATASCVILPAFVGATPGLVPALFGSQWAEASLVIPGASLGLMIIGTLGAGGIGFLFADDRPGAVVKATLVAGITTISAAVVFVSSFGIAGLGVALALGAAAEGIVVSRELQRSPGVDVIRPLLVPLVIAVAAGAAGWVVAEDIGEPGLAAIAGGTVAASVSLTGLVLLSRHTFMDLYHVCTASIGDATGFSWPLKRRRASL